MSVCEMDPSISSIKTSEALTSLRDAERAIIWLQEAAQDSREVERLTELTNVWKQIHGAIEAIHPYQRPMADRIIEDEIGSTGAGSSHEIEWKPEALDAAWKAFNSVTPAERSDNAGKQPVALVRLLNAACRAQGIISNSAAVETDHYDGGCPVCGGVDGMANAGRSHWYYCSKHKKTWTPGANLYSGWRDQTEGEQRKIWEEIGLDEFEVVEPIYPKETPQKASPRDRVRAIIDEMLSNEDLIEISQYALSRLHANILVASTIPF